MTLRTTTLHPLRTAAVLVSALAALAGAAAPAAAQTAAAKAAVDAGKAQGRVGEQADGYLGLVSGEDGALRSAVAEINTGRAAAYRDAAGKTGVTAAAAGEATARQLQARTPSGQYVRSTAGTWTRK